VLLLPERPAYLEARPVRVLDRRLPMVDQGFRLRRPAQAVLGAGIRAALVARSPWVVAAMPEGSRRPWIS
jgi:hypothetical protein